MEAKNVKGTRDILLNETGGFRTIENILTQICGLFGYHELRTPILEHSEVFARGVGEGSDIVRKEMYTFEDKAGRSVTMRPEFTAGIIRSFIQNKMHIEAELPVKIFYHGPAFRYERPQLGRYRQFSQFGVESIGSSSLYNDAEVITMAYTMLASLALNNVTLKINCLGDKESRDNYREALKKYFEPHLDNMCPDCKERFRLNPLRILDCKVEEDKILAKDAPKIKDYLSASSLERFEKIKSALRSNNIPFVEDDQLVRGLDYYSEIVFEFAYVSKTGKDYGALGGGGHYGNLMKELGGPDLPGVGFSFGVERLFDILVDDGILEAKTSPVDIYVMPLGDEAKEYALNIANRLRVNGFATDMCFDDVKLGAMIKRALKKGASFAVIIGEDEIANNKLMVKNLKENVQEEVSSSELITYFNNLYMKSRGGCSCGRDCSVDCADCSCDNNCSGGNNNE